MVAQEWIRASATCIGSSHIKSDTECQDFHRTFEVVADDRQFLVLIGSDGAGSYDYGKIGAVLVCEILGSLARTYLNEYRKLPEEHVIASWFQYLQLVLINVSENMASEIRQFSATALLAIYSDNILITAHVGDGAIVIRTSDDEWQTISKPENGEYASTTYFVTDTKNLRLRIRETCCQLSGISLFTDGIESLVLDSASMIPHAGFLEPFYSSLSKGALKNGRDCKFSNQLKGFLLSERINDRTDDDKTFVIAVKRTP